MSPRASKGSLKIARQTLPSRTSRRKQSTSRLSLAIKNVREFDVRAFLSTLGEGRTVMLFPLRGAVFVQGDPADAVFYLLEGEIRLTVVSKTGKEASISILSDGSFLDDVKGSRF